MTVPAELIELVERFERNIEAYKSGQYNEAQVRREYIDPFFELLGWDIQNKQGYAEAYKDVIHEDSLRIGGTARAPDYGFRIGGTRKFFLEAKKPSVDIKGSVGPSFQVRRYAWSAKLPLSILTDFEELAVYDCRIKPDKNDKASKARTMYLTFDQYPDKWEEISSIFSRDAVLKGSFDKYAMGTGKKRGTAEVDKAFLSEIESWRDILARNIALRNPALTQRELNFTVQKIIDRIIFLRICEDRGIENYLQLMSLTSGPDTYSRLLELFRHADQRYNSGLFHFSREKGRPGEPDSLTPNIAIDDKALKGIIKNLYYPDSPYEFSVLPADILGQVYEQFLGKVIRLTKGHQARVEDKPEVKKAGGVYYTPTYIVDYIVKNTVEKLLDGKTPKQAEKLSILDPACGSGSFLIGAYQYLLDWHREYYEKKDPAKRARGNAPPVYQGPGGEWRLTTSEKKRILLNNIYGVDIDLQAVEVTKLSLLLKVLEDENRDTLQSQLSLFKERALPDLGNNIKCGNSLIGPDFYDGQQMSFLDEEERYRINVFDWDSEFPAIMKAGGFDAVIGNPPYVRQEGLGTHKEYYLSHYKTFKSTADLYINFIEKGIGLLNQNGLFSMIVSNKWLRAAYGGPLRRFLTEEASVLQITDLAGLPAFPSVTVRTIILMCSPVKGLRTKYLAPIPLDEFKTIKSGERLQEIFDSKSTEMDLSTFGITGWSLSGQRKVDIVKRMRSVSSGLSSYLNGKTYFGIKSGHNKAFVIDQSTYDQLIGEDPKSCEILKPLIVGRDIRRYQINYKNRYLIWTYIGISIEKYPAIFNHLKQFQQKLEKRWDKGDHWWELRACNYYDRFENPKIIYPDISTTCRFTLDRNKYFSTNTTYFIDRNDPYLLGILNSKLSHLYFSEVCAELEGGGTSYLRFFGQYLGDFPVKVIDFSIVAEKTQHDKIVLLVEEILSLNKQLTMAKTNHEKTNLQRQIDAIDRQIDNMVFELYGLTDEEIRIVEGDE